MTQLPQSRSDEAALLGGLLVYPVKLNEVRTVVRDEQDFADHRHRYIYRALCTLVEGGEVPSMSTVQSFLERQGSLGKAGGIAYLAKLVDTAAAASTVDRHARIVAEAADRRRVIQAAAEVAAISYDQSEDWDEQRAALRGLFEDAMQSYLSIKSKSIVELVATAKKRALEYAADPLEPGEVRGIPTGIKDLDLMMHGLGTGLYLIGAVQHTGKTAFVQQIAINSARLGWPAVFYSMEHGADHMADRIISMEAGIDIHEILTGLRGVSLEKYKSTAKTVSSWPIDIVDNRLTMAGIEADIRARAAQGLRLAVIDNLEVLSESVPGEKQYVSYQRTAYRVLSLAQAADVPILITMQIGEKQLSGQNEWRPTVANLYGASGPAQAASVIWLLHRASRVNPDYQGADILEVITPKDKVHYCGSGKVRRFLFGPQGQILDLAREEAPF